MSELASYRVELPFDEQKGTFSAEEDIDRQNKLKVDLTDNFLRWNLRASVNFGRLHTYSFLSSEAQHSSETSPYKEQIIRKFGFVGIVSWVELELDVPARCTILPGHTEPKYLEEQLSTYPDFVHQRMQASVKEVIEGSQQSSLPEWLRAYARVPQSNSCMVGYLETRDGIPSTSSGATLFVDEENGAFSPYIREKTDSLEFPFSTSPRERLELFANLMIEPEWVGAD